MKNALYLVLFCISFSLVSCRSRAPGKYFGRPKVFNAINSNCTGFINGEAIDVTNWLSIKPEDYETIRSYYERREFCHYICIRYPKKCKACK